MWTNKNFRLSVILGVLLLITTFQLLRKDSVDQFELDKNMFSLTDTSSINRIEILYNNEEVIIARDGNTWKLGTYKIADEYYLSLLKAVLSSIEVQRKVSKAEMLEIQPEMQFAKVRIGLENGKEFNFIAGGNENQTLSYFGIEDSKQLFVVNIPGYRSFVSGIFMLSALEWEDKTLFTTPWTSLRKLSVSYPSSPEKNFTIVQDNGFLKVDGVSEVDTVRMMDYVSIYSGLRANFFFKSEEFDSLLNTEEEVTISIEDINYERNNELKIFQLQPGAQIQIGVTRSGQVIGFDYRNVRFLARSREYFSTVDHISNP